VVCRMSDRPMPQASQAVEWPLAVREMQRKLSCSQVHVGCPYLCAKGQKLMYAARYFFTFPVADTSGPRVYLSAKETVGKELFRMTANELHEIQASNPVAQFFHARSDWKPLNQGH
jgi:hypothetical protein